jgi:hypothetical protein
VESTSLSGAKPESAGERVFDRGAAVTRSLLGYGVLAGPFYLALGLGQALVRDGFDLARHPLSVLANGTGGWVQTANFVITGLMVIAAAVGIARVPGPRARAVSWFLGAFGASMIVAAAFRADPMDGFPPGTPAGNPTSISGTGMVHFAAGALGFVSLAVACLLAAWAMSRRNERALSRLSLASGLVVLLGFFGGSLLGSHASPVLGIWIAVVVGWVWLAILSLRLYHIAPDPNCAPRSH